MVIFGGCVSQKKPTVYAKSQEVSDNLDLEAVASVFGDVRNLEEFERILNDEKEHISNLDLNNDGYTDYLRVVESIEGNVHVITIQAALGNDIFQDVATIDVDRDYNNRSNVQVIGSPYFYGNNFIIEPVYYHNPYIFDVFWSPNYSPWRSPYYWSYYPNYYRPWKPWAVNRYVSHVYKVRNVKNNYRYTNQRFNTNAVNIQKQNRRDDYSKRRPEASFNSRNGNVENKADLKRNPTNTPRERQSDNRANTGRNDDQNSGSKPSRNTKSRENTPSKPKTEEKSRATKSTRESSRGSRSSGATSKSGTKRGNLD